MSLQAMQIPYQSGGATPAPLPFPQAPAAPSVSSPARMPQDSLTLSGARPAFAPTSAAPTTLGGAIRELLASVVDFFKRLFGGGKSQPTPVSPIGGQVPIGGAYPPSGNPYPVGGQVPGGPWTAPAPWPAFNPDAREQLFAQFPTGNGVALGMFPVQVYRNGEAIVASAPGVGQGAIVRYQGNLFVHEGSKPPVRVAQATSQRAPNGDTRFDLVLETGKAVSAELLADGRTIRYRGYSITIA